MACKPTLRMWSHIDFNTIPPQSTPLVVLCSFSCTANAKCDWSGVMGPIARGQKIKGEGRVGEDTRNITRRLLLLPERLKAPHQRPPYGVTMLFYGLDIFVGLTELIKVEPRGPRPFFSILYAGDTCSVLEFLFKWATVPIR
ncbi:hypothetical protein AAC387_Pa09g1136 [Persea americana]